MRSVVRTLAERACLRSAFGGISTTLRMLRGAFSKLTRLSRLSDAYAFVDPVYSGLARAMGNTPESALLTSGPMP